MVNLYKGASNHVETMFSSIDSASFQNNVLTISDTPPAETEGNRYISLSTQHILEFRHLVWNDITPSLNWIVYVDDEKVLKKYNGWYWESFSSPLNLSLNITTQINDFVITDFSPDENSICVYRNGILQEENSDYLVNFDLTDYILTFDIDFVEGEHLEVLSNGIVSGSLGYTLINGNTEYGVYWRSA